MRISAQLIDATSARIFGPTGLTARPPTFSTFRTRWPRPAPGSPPLQAAETARSANRPTSDLTAYDLYLRPYEMYFASAQLIPDALRLLEQAIKRDPLARGT